MTDKKQQQILKHLNQIRQDIKDIEPHVSHIDNIPRYLGDAVLDILTVYDMVKKDNQKEEYNGKKEIIQYKIEG